MYKLIAISLLFLSSSGIFAQTKLRSDSVDVKTYDYYVKGEWDKIITLGEEALDSGIDFYYLRMRLGIAEFSRQDYIAAIPNFEKALTFVNNDSNAAGYLFLSNLLSGRDGESEVLSERLTQDQKRKFMVRQTAIFDGLYTESGYTYNKDFNSQKENFTSSANIYDEQKIFKDAFYFNLSLSHKLSKRVKLFHGYNFISLSYLKQFNEFQEGKREFNVKTNQNEYYINANIYLGKGFTLTPALHYLNIKVEDMNFRYDTTNAADIPIYSNYTNTLNNYVLFLSLQKDFHKFRLSLANSFSDINNSKQIQNALQVVYFPLGSLNLYTVTDFILFSEKKSDEDLFTKGIFEQKAGFRILPFLWLEAFYTFGKIYNYNESNAFVVYNSGEVIKNRYGVNFLMPVLSGKMELSIRYQSYKQEMSYLTYTSFTNYIINKKQNLNYKLIGGIKWTF